MDKITSLTVQFRKAELKNDIRFFLTLNKKELSRELCFNFHKHCHCYQSNKQVLQRAMYLVQ